MEDFTLPKVVVPQRVLQSIFQDVLAHPSVETGHGLIGIELPDLIVIVDVLPDFTDIRRTSYSLHMGGDTQLALFEWYQRHWQQVRAQSHNLDLPDWYESGTVLSGTIPQELSVPLSLVGDWHKHPGTLETLSYTDYVQIDKALTNPDTNRLQIITPIVTYKPGHTVLNGYDGHQLVLQQVGEEMRVNWYYSHRDTPYTYLFLPTIVPDHAVPGLPPIPWYLRNGNRMLRELSLLRNAGFEVSWKLRKVKTDNIHAICFTINHTAWDDSLLIITAWNYPAVEAKVYAIPKKNIQPNPTWLDELHERMFATPKKNLWDLARSIKDIVVPNEYPGYLVNIAKQHALKKIEAQNVE